VVGLVPDAPAYVIPQGSVTTDDNSTHWCTAAAWWIVLVATLVVLDDLTFGPLFWFISRTAGPTYGFGAAIAVYVPVQIWLVRRGTTADPGLVAGFFLKRLSLERRSSQVAVREQALHRRVRDSGTAFALALVIGGVLPPLLLQRRGFPTQYVRRLSYVTAPIYALEFAVLHGLTPGLL
jgi:hypothetical protein